MEMDGCVYGVTAIINPHAAACCTVMVIIQPTHSQRGRARQGEIKREERKRERVAEG